MTDRKCPIRKLTRRTSLTHRSTVYTGEHKQLQQPAENNGFYTISEYVPHIVERVDKMLDTYDAAQKTRKERDTQIHQMQSDIQWII